MKWLAIIQGYFKVHPGRKRFAMGSAVLLGLGFLAATLMALSVFIYGEKKREPLPTTHSADVILILDGGTHRDGMPSNAQLRRVNHAVLLYRHGVAPYILCTGGLDRPDYVKTEAQACVDQATALGVPASAILREDVSLNTEQNLFEAQKVLDAKQLRMAIIVSDSFHLFRAERLVMHYRLNVVAYSPAQATQGALPLVEGAISCYREVGAMIWDTIRIIQGG